MIAEHRHLVSQGAKLVELRLDYINGQINLKRLLADKPCPVVITLRREIDGGKWRGSEDERQMLMRAAIVDGVDYIDLEEDVAKSIRRYGKTKRIVSYHDFRQTPEDLPAIHARLAALDADVVKLATMANSPHDNLRMMQLVQSAKVPTVGMCMGDLGTPSRILCGRFGAPFTYASFHHERLLAPGQLSFDQMMNVYHYDAIDSQTKVLGVIADPIGHSLSPLVHNTALRQAGLNAVYVPFRVPAEHLEQFLTDAPLWGIRGLSVTIPHKEAVLKKLSKFDPAVKGIGAANTLVWENDGLIGYNTDFRAAMDSLERAVESSSLPVVHQENGFDFGGRRRRAGDGVWTEKERGRRRHHQPHAEARPAVGPFAGLRLDRLEQPLRHFARHRDQLQPGGDAPQRRRNAVRSRPSAQLDGRVRHGLQSGKHAVGEGSPRARLHRRHRRGNVRPPGKPAIPPVHRPRRAVGTDARHT